MYIYTGVYAGIYISQDSGVGFNGCVTLVYTSALSARGQRLPLWRRRRGVVYIYMRAYIYSTALRDQVDQVPGV